MGQFGKPFKSYNKRTHRNETLVYYYHSGGKRKDLYELSISNVPRGNVRGRR